MSELKARTARSIANEEEMLELGADCPIESAQVYLKSETDKVITKLKEKLVEQTTLRVWAEIQLRHNKYKRCLAMAMWCSNKWADIATPYVKSVWYRKWQLRWLELAEKFKDKKV